MHLLRLWGLIMILFACPAAMPHRVVAQDDLQNERMIDLQRGDLIPEVSFTSTTGQVMSTRGFDSKVQVFLFGRSEHERTGQACGYIQSALQNTQLEDVVIDLIFVLSKPSDPALVQACFTDERIEPIIVHDRTRAMFGSFKIITMPAVVVVDEQHRVVYSIPSMSPRFGDLVGDAILLGAQKIAVDQFEQTLHPNSVPLNGDRVKAKRVMKLARQAAKRGLEDMAVDQYAHAIELDPSWIPPRLALGYLQISQGHLDQAKHVFELILEIEPGHTDGLLGLAKTLIDQGGADQLAEAERIILEIISHDPDNARAHYTLGMLYQAQGIPERAIVEYKRAAKIMLKALDPSLMID